jgi:hypothetical protein
VLGLHSHCKHASPGRRPRKPAAHPISTQSRDRSGCGLDPGVCLLSAPAGPRAHTHAHARRRDPVLCPALPCLVAAIATGTGHGAIFFFFFFFLAFPCLAWAVRERRWGRDRRCFGACGQASGSRMLGRCSSCCGMFEAGLFVVVYSETNSLVSDRETGRFACVVRDLRCRGLSSGILLVPTPENTVGQESRTRGSSAAYVTRLPAPSGGGVSLRRAAAGGERVRG